MLARVVQVAASAGEVSFGKLVGVIALAASLSCWRISSCSCQ